MLVLSRKLGESVTIEGVGTVHVVRCTNNGCKLAFDAPQNVNIVRSELLEESAGHGSKHDASRMDGDGQGGPFYDHEPLIVGGKYSL